MWLARNLSIFENKSFQAHRVFVAIKLWVEDGPRLFNDNVGDASHRIRAHEIGIPAIYFDGASANGLTSCGVWIKISDKERYHIYWNRGPGSNNKAEIMALWGGLLAATDLQLQDIHIYGDSQLIIGWITNSFHIYSPPLIGWIDRTRSLWHRLNRPPIKHIFRENNTRADQLSKMGLLADFGSMKVIHFYDDKQTGEFSIPIP